eukprot:8164938-Pyramimonas_sp.AAC.1
MFADLARLAERLQTSGFNGRTRLVILNAIAVFTSSVAGLQLELRTKYRQRVSRSLETAVPAGTLFGLQ